MLSGAGVLRDDDGCAGGQTDEEADDAFCQRMVENYENDPDPEKDKGYSLEDCKREWGID